ncbi:hypothetical protein C8J57DRAFT_1525552 [Mycena rebaudengoi]|nr:hypothetical protein C8J57DRAFT_1525552 [Mycena rebaudengoi]
MSRRKVRQQAVPPSTSSRTSSSHPRSCLTASTTPPDLYYIIYPTDARRPPPHAQRSTPPKYSTPVSHSGQFLGLLVLLLTGLLVRTPPYLTEISSRKFPRRADVDCASPIPSRFASRRHSPPSLHSFARQAARLPRTTYTVDRKRFTYVFRSLEPSTPPALGVLSMFVRTSFRLHLFPLRPLLRSSGRAAVR